MLLTELFLNEVEWADQSPLFPVLLENRRRFIHFATIPKLGIKPMSTWKAVGPLGVYFYPVDFLLSDHTRVREGEQFATEFPYYFLADIDKSMPGADLERVSMAEARKIAADNGWVDFFDRYLKADGISSHAARAGEEGRVGEMLWQFAKNLHHERIMSWNRAFKSLAWISDSTGVIYGNLEPHQIVVMDPRAIKNVTMGRNTAVGYNGRQTDPISANKPLAMNILNTVQEKLGGEIKWRKIENLKYHSNYIKASRRPAMPYLRLTSDDRQIEIATNIDGAYNLELKLQYRFGREKGSASLSAGDVRRTPFNNLVADIIGYVQAVKALKTDLRFEPYLSIDEAVSVMQRAFSDFSPTPKVTIRNDPDEQNVLIVGEEERDVFGVRVDRRASVTVEREMIYSSYISIAVGLSSVISMHQYNMKSVDEMMELNFSDFRQYLERLEKMFGPAVDRTSKFDERTWPAFIGWLIEAAGLTLGGRLDRAFSEEITAYRSWDDKDALTYEIYRIFNRR